MPSPPAASPIEIALRKEAERVFGSRAAVAEVEPGVWSVVNDGTAITSKARVLLDILKAMPEVKRA